jgi:hypothetical protein
MGKLAGKSNQDLVRKETVQRQGKNDLDHLVFARVIQDGFFHPRRRSMRIAMRRTVKKNITIS